MKDKKDDLKQFEGNIGAYRKDVISDTEYFMKAAELASKRSLDPSTQVGAVYVKKNEIIGIGHNRMPNGMDPDRAFWSNDTKNNPLCITKYDYITHAECVGILNAKKKKLKGSTLYVTLYPCSRCAATIANYGIKKVIYKERRIPDDIVDSSERILNECGIKFISIEEQLKKEEKKLILKNKKKTN